MRNGDKVLVRDGLVAIPSIYISGEGDDVVVAVAPESNRTEDVTGFETWDRMTVQARRVRLYEW